MLKHEQATRLRVLQRLGALLYTRFLDCLISTSLNAHRNHVNVTEVFFAVVLYYDMKQLDMKPVARDGLDLPRTISPVRS